MKNTDLHNNIHETHFGVDNLKNAILNQKFFYGQT